MKQASIVSLDERCKEILEMLVDALGLDDIDYDTYNYAAPLFASQDETGEGLELDSVDALEIVVSIKSNYGIKLADEEKHVLKDIESIAKFINEKLNEVV